MLWHEHLRRTAKLLLTGTAHYTGLLGSIRRVYMKDQALILMYHRVSPKGKGVPDYSPNGISVTPAEFEMQMRFLREHYDIVPLSHIVSAVRGERAFTPNMCAVTFDDGWHDVYEHAFLILKRYSIPATIYLTTGFIDGTEWFWEERSKYLLALIYKAWKTPSQKSEAAMRTQVDLEKFSLGKMLQIQAKLLPAFLLQEGRFIKEWDPERRLALMQTLERLATQLCPDAPRPFMNWSEVQEMSRGNIEFGSHTISHPALPDLSAEEARNELNGAAKRIESNLGQVPTNFAYPYGKFNEHVRRQVLQEGLASASTTRLGLVKRNADPYALNRVNVCSDVCGHQPLFAARILGF